jgi:hypothetical protein
MISHVLFQKPRKSSEKQQYKQDRSLFYLTHANVHKKIELYTHIYGKMKFNGVFI